MTTTPSDEAVTELVIGWLKAEEGYSPRPYDDSTGKPVTAPSGTLTIGWGTNLQDRDIEPEVAELMLRLRVRDSLQEVNKHIPSAIAASDVRHAVLVDMAYNLGIGGLLKFSKMIAAVDNQHYWPAADEMRDSVWYRQVGARAEILARRMESGQV